MDDDRDPEPPAPTEPAVPPCREFAGSGTRRSGVGFGLADWVEDACTWCAGTGAHAAPAPACPACTGSGQATDTAFAGAACWYCDGSGADGVAAVPSVQPVPFDRVAHCRKIAGYGAAATVTIHGIHHMRVIG